MKKMLLASAFALFGSFAMANVTDQILNYQFEETERECATFKSKTECGGYYTACHNGEGFYTEKLDAVDRAMCDALKEIEQSVPGYE